MKKEGRTLPPGSSFTNRTCPIGSLRAMNQMLISSRTVLAQAPENRKNSDMKDRKEHLINTGALARWKDALWLQELFKQFARTCGKPLKRLTPLSAQVHRAEAPVLMRTSSIGSEMFGPELFSRRARGTRAPASTAMLRYRSQPIKSASARWRARTFP